MGKVPGYKVRIKGSRRELIWKGNTDGEEEEEEEKWDGRSGLPDMRIRASRRELVWDKGEVGRDEEGEEQESKDEKEESARKKKEEDLYYGGQKIKHFKSKEELPNTRVNPSF